MIRITVMYPSNTGEFNFDYYTQKHLPLVNRLFEPYGLVGAEIDKGIGAERFGKAAPFIAICYFTFNSMEKMLKGMVNHFQEMEADVPNFTDINSTYQISEIL